MAELTTEEHLARWKDLTAHIVTVLLVVGFFGIVYLALTGVVRLTDPTTATFVGTVTGYAIGQLAKPLNFYFTVPRRDALRPFETTGPSIPRTPDAEP